MIDAVNGTGSFWGESGGWVHRADLDFCPRCQRDGSVNYRRLKSDGFMA
jgi:hypothetical protein